MMLQITSVVCSPQDVFQCLFWGASVAAAPFYSIVMCERSVSSKLFQFLLALHPSEEKAALFAQNLKFVLERLREGCLLQSVSISLPLLFLHIGCGRKTLLWH